MSDDILSRPVPQAGVVAQDDQLISHWEELAEWPPDRLLHACYLTVVDQPELQAAVSDYQIEMAGLPGLDLILPQWLHMTIQGVRFIDQIVPEAIVDLAWRLDDLLQTVEPFEVVVERPIVTYDSALMPVRPIEALAAIRDDIRGLLGSMPAFGDLFVLPGQDGDFDPHISIAYVNAPTARHAMEQAIAACQRDPVTISVNHVSMITLLRSDRKYHWVDERPIRLLG